MSYPGFLKLMFDCDEAGGFNLYPELYFVLQIFQSQARNLYGLLPGGRAAHDRDGAPGQAKLVSQEDY
jgi:hypothetical protein